MRRDEQRPITTEQLWSAMRRDSQGLRDLRDYLEGIKHLDGPTFAETTGGVDRAETMELLDRLNSLLAELDSVTAQMHRAVN